MITIFHIVQIRYLDHICFFPLITTASVSAVNPFVKRMDLIEQEEFISDYIQNVIDLGLCENGRFLTPYKMLIVTATK